MIARGKSCKREHVLAVIYQRGELGPACAQLIGDVSPSLDAALASACRKACRIAAATVVCWLWHVGQGVTEMSLAQLGNPQLE